MVHISPWEATLGLLAGAARLLASGAPLILYGPYIEPDVPTAASNLAFDAILRARDPAWGLRDTEAVQAAAHDAGLTVAERRQMPAHHLMLPFRRTRTPRPVPLTAPSTSTVEPKGGNNGV